MFFILLSSDYLLFLMRINARSKAAVEGYAAQRKPVETTLT